MKFHERQEDGTWVEKDEPVLTKTGRVMTEVEIGLLSDLEAARHDLDEARSEIEQIGRLVHEALDAPARPLEDSREAFRHALRQIRTVVG